MNNLFFKLNGYKSYVLALIAALYAVAYLGFYENNWDEAKRLLWEAAGLAGIRHAIAKGF